MRRHVPNFLGLLFWHPRQTLWNFCFSAFATELYGGAIFRFRHPLQLYNRLLFFIVCQIISIVNKRLLEIQWYYAATEESWVAVTAASLASALGGTRRGRSYWCKCPIHKGGNEKRPSLQITDGDHTVLVRCWAGCDTRAVIRELVRLGLWESKETSLEERRRRQAEQQERVATLQLMREYLAAVDLLKIKALNSGNWDDWKALCRAQGKVQGKLSQSSARIR